jgi:nitrite reductase (NADH) small subunit
MAWQRVAESAAVTAERFVLLRAGKREIGVTRHDGVAYAILNHCPHAGAPLCAGRIELAVCSDGPGHADRDPHRPVLRCPWHHWEFSLHDGRPLCGSSGRMKLYPVKEEDGWVWVDV